MTQKWPRLGFPAIQVPCLDDLFEAGLRFTVRSPWDGGWSRWVQSRWAPQAACGTAHLGLEAGMISASPAHGFHPVCPTTGHSPESWRSIAGVNHNNGHWGWQDGWLGFPHSSQQIINSINWKTRRHCWMDSLCRAHNKKCARIAYGRRQRWNIKIKYCNKVLEAVPLPGLIFFFFCSVLALVTCKVKSRLEEKARAVSGKNKAEVAIMSEKSKERSRRSQSFEKEASPGPTKITGNLTIHFSRTRISLSH